VAGSDGADVDEAIEGGRACSGKREEGKENPDDIALDEARDGFWTIDADVDRELGGQIADKVELPLRVGRCHFATEEGSADVAVVDIWAIGFELS
jgi:hypothetical protein